jgi:hypothetical protein
MEPAEVEKVEGDTPTSKEDTTVRVLQAFLDYLPKDGREIFNRDLQSLPTDQDVYDYAESLLNGLLLPMRTLRSIPTLSEFVKIDSIEDIASQSTSTGPEAQKARLKLDCLERDGMKCVITGRKNVGKIYTDCVHIIPLSLTKWEDRCEEEAKDIIWTNLARYFPALENSAHLTRASMNESCNAMSMSCRLGDGFSNFDFAFEQTAQPQVYRLKIYKRHLLLELPRTVTFECHDPRYALPNLELLKVHATISRIFHALGLAEYIRKSCRDIKETRVLANDGSTDISSLLAATSLGALGAVNISVQHNLAEDSDSEAEAEAQSVPKADSGLTQV